MTKLLIRLLCWTGLHEWTICSWENKETRSKLEWVECAHCGMKLVEK